MTSNDRASGLLPDLDRQTARQPGPRRRLLLTNHAGLHRRDPPWHLIEHVVRELKPDDHNRFCLLEDETGSYVQTLCGLNGYHLERRITDGGADGSYLHLRGSYPGGSQEPDALRVVQYVNDGEQRDILYCDDVVDAFREFCQASQAPGWLDWRPIEV